MTLTEDVMNDLLTIYLAGEASADTRALIEDRAARDAGFAARLAAARAVDVSAALPGSPSPDAELRALAQTRQAIFLRTLFFAAAVFFTLLPLSFRGGANGLEFLFLGKQPGACGRSGAWPRRRGPPLRDAPRGAKTGL